MSAQRTGSTRIAWALVVALVAGGAGWWTWMRAKLPEMAAISKEKPPFVQIAGSGIADTDKVLLERADLMDPTPLFFPTEWNYGQRPLRLTLKKREPTQVFAGIDPQFNFPEQGAKFYGSEPATVTEQLPDVLAQGIEAPFAGLGQVDGKLPQIPARDGFIEIRRLGGQEIVLKQVLIQVKPPRSDFAPIEFLVVVDATGLVGGTVLATGSGVEEVDLFFRSYLTNVFRVGERLAPGRYRVVVGA